MGAGLLNLAPVLQSFQSPAPAPQTTPQSPSVQPNADSLIHQHTAAILSQKPDATAYDVASALGNGVSPTLAAKVISDVRGIRTGVGQPPQSVAQATGPGVPPPAQRPLPLPVQAALALASVPTPPGPQQPPPPNSLGNTASIANAARLAGLQNVADNGPLPAPMIPGAGQGPAGSPPSPVGTSSLPPPPPTAVGAPSNPMPPPNMQNRLTLQNNAATQPNGTYPTDSAPNVAPGATPKGGPPAWLRGLERFAPALGVALLSRNNPGAGAAVLGGWNAGEQQKQAEAAQKAQVARETAQQQFENAQATNKATQDQQHQQFSDRNDFYEQLRKTDAAGQEQMVKALPDAEAQALGIDKSTFYGPDGKFIPQTSAEKPLDPVAMARAQAANLDKLQGLTTDSQQHIHDTMDDAEWKATYGVPYDNFTPVQRSKDATAAVVAATGAQKAQTAADLAKAHIQEILAGAGLKVSQGKYYDVKTSRVVPDSVATDKMKDATTKFLGTRNDLAPGEAHSQEAYRAAMGAAASSNAQSNAFNAETKAELAQAQIHKIVADTGYTEARIKQVAEKDPYFTAMVTMRDKANDLKAQAAKNTTYDAPTRARIMAGYDADIHKADDYINSRLTSNGQSAPPASGTGQAPVVDRRAQRALAGRALAMVGQTVNSDGQPSCADGVCKIAKAVGVPVPQTRSAAEFEKQLPSKGWTQIPLAQAAANDIITSKGSGPSGRHVQWSIGGGQVIEADSRASGYSNRLTKGSIPSSDPSATAWRYNGAPKNGPPPPKQTASLPLPTVGKLSTGITYKVLP
jgi:hypothetical protein